MWQLLVCTVKHKIRSHQSMKGCSLAWGGLTLCTPLAVDLNRCPFYGILIGGTEFFLGGEMDCHLLGFFKIKIYYVCVWMSCLNVWLCTMCMPGADRNQNRLQIL